MIDQSTFDLDELIERAIIHMHTVHADQRMQAEEEHACKEREREEKRLADWKPHVDVIRAALPGELRGATIIPRDTYSSYQEYTYEYAPCEIQIGHLRVFAWHWYTRASNSEVLIFAPGILKLDSPDDWDTIEVRWTTENWYRSNEGSQSDFMLALGESAAHYEANWSKLQREVADRMAPRPEPTPKPAKPEPTAAEQLAAAIYRIVEERITAAMEEGME